MPDSNSVTFQIFVKAGSVYENLENNGIAHAMEHMFFKWWKKYKNPIEVAQSVDSFGWEFNAYTNIEYVSYYIKSSPEYIEKAIDVISDMICYAKFDTQELEREKWVIIQEIAMYKDDPKDVISEKWNMWRFGDNSLGRPVIWTQKSVMWIDREKLLEYKDNLYTKDNMIFAIVWKIENAEKIQKIIEKKFVWLPSKKKLIRPNYKIKLPSDKFFRYKQKTKQNHLIISAKWFDWSQEEKYASKILSIILGGNMSSRLFQNVREKYGLCYYISSHHLVDIDNWFFKIVAWIDKDRFDFGFEKIMSELEKISSDWVLESEYQNAIWFLMWKLSMWLESSDDISDFIWSQYICYGEFLTLEQLKEKYKKVTIEQINKIAKKLSKKNLRRCRIW